MSSFSHAGSAPAPRRHAFALWTVLAAQLMLAMDFLIVVVALPRIQQDLGFSGAGLTWVPNAFGLAFGGLSERGRYDYSVDETVRIEWPAPKRRSEANLR